MLRRAAAAFLGSQHSNPSSGVPMEQLTRNRFSEPAPPDQLEAAADALAAKGINAHHVDDFDAARELVLDLIPDRSSVMNFPSVTLEQTGVLDPVAASGRYD